MSDLLQVQQLEVLYDTSQVLFGLNLTLRQGETLALLGRNGAGKSTLLKILNGLIRPDSGRITMRGRVGALIELSAGFNPICAIRGHLCFQERMACDSSRRPQILHVSSTDRSHG